MSGLSDSLAGVVSIAALVVPLFAIPFAFSIAGGIIGKAHETFTSARKRGHQAMLGNQNDPNSWRNRARHNLTDQYTRQQLSVMDRGDAVGASTRQRLAGRLAGRVWGRTDERMSAAMLRARDRQNAMSATGRDAERYAAGGWILRAGEQAPDFLHGIAGTTENHDRYINSKGKEIGQELYTRGKRNHGSTLSGVAQALEYTTGKIQTDQDIANVRESFRRNAIAGNWNETEVYDQWAASKYPHKQLMGAEWYSAAERVIDPATGRTADIRWNDVSQDAGSYAKYIGEKHKAIQSYQLGGTRDSDARASADVVQQVEGALTSGAPVSQQQLENLAMTHEVFEQMQQKGFMTQDSEGHVSIAGASAATNKVVEVMRKNMKYDVAPTKDPITGDYSVNERHVYKVADVEAAESRARAAWAAGGNSPASFRFSQASRDAAIAAASAGRVNVTGDIGRSLITDVGAP